MVFATAQQTPHKYAACAYTYSIRKVRTHAYSNESGTCAHHSAITMPECANRYVRLLSLLTAILWSNCTYYSSVCTYRQVISDSSVACIQSASKIPFCVLYYEGVVRNVRRQDVICMHYCCLILVCTAQSLVINTYACTLTRCTCMHGLHACVLVTQSGQK